MKEYYERKQAIALSYEAERDEAPKVVAKGKGLVADRIIEKATEHGLPIQQDESLVQLLGQLQINEKIPEELYQAVAEIFAFIYRVDRSLGETK